MFGLGGRSSPSSLNLAMDAFLRQDERRYWPRRTRYLLGSLLFVITVLTQMLLTPPWPVLATLAGFGLWLLWPLLKRLGRYVWWSLVGLWMLGVVSAEPAMRSQYIMGTLILLLIVLIVRRYFGNLGRAFQEGYQEPRERKAVTSVKEQSHPFEIWRADAEAIDWNQVIIPETTKQDLQIIQGVLRDYAGLRQNWGQEPPLGMLLHGPPGTGKTLIAQTLAGTSDYAFISVSASDIMDAAVGSSEQKVHVLYEQAREAAPCIVFIDEIDSLASRRSSTGMDWGGAVRGYNNTTSQLLQEIDGFQQSEQPVFTVGATNRLDVLDEALHSRLSYHVFVGLPDESARQKLFELYTRPYAARLRCSSSWLAQQSEGLSGRDIREACRWVATYAHGVGMDEVGCEVFERSLSNPH